jgi:hypothetical protein
MLFTAKKVYRHSLSPRTQNYLGRNQRIETDRITERVAAAALHIHDRFLPNSLFILFRQLCYHSSY